MSEKPITYLGTSEFPFTIEVTPGDYSADFRVWKEIAWDIGRLDKATDKMVADPYARLYELAEHRPAETNTEDRNLAEVFLRGFIKWDGCSNWNFDCQESCMIHFCGRGDAAGVGKLFDRLYDLAGAHVEQFDRELAS